MRTSKYSVHAIIHKTISVYALRGRIHHLFNAAQNVIVLGADVAFKYYSEDADLPRIVGSSKLVSHFTVNGTTMVNNTFTDMPYAASWVLLVFRYSTNYVIQVCMPTSSVNKVYVRTVHRTNYTVYADWKLIVS